MSSKVSNEYDMRFRTSKSIAGLSDSDYESNDHSPVSFHSLTSIFLIKFKFLTSSISSQDEMSLSSKGLNSFSLFALRL